MPIKKGRTTTMATMSQTKSPTTLEEIARAIRPRHRGGQWQARPCSKCGTDTDLNVGLPDVRRAIREGRALCETCETKTSSKI